MKKEISVQDLINHDLSEYLRFSKMLSKTVHDINNPLAVFIGQLSIIELLKERDQLTPEKLDIILDKFTTSSKTFKERLDHLRGFYKVPVNDEHYRQLHQIMSSITYYFENEMYLHGINLSLNVDENIELAIPADTLFIINKHLIQNSIEALNEHNKDGGNIEINCIDNGNSVKIEISDSGPGLVCDLEMAMNLGYTTKTEKHGGFGLAMVQKILESNNLSLEYNKDEKCTFSVIYPRK